LIFYNSAAGATLWPPNTSKACTTAASSTNN
jgi:hypothetical protein